MGTLNDRTFESFRWVAPGRSVPDRKTSALHSEEYAQAVVGLDGTSLTASAEALLRQLALAAEETNTLLTLILAQLSGGSIQLEGISETWGQPMLGELAS